MQLIIIAKYSGESPHNTSGLENFDKFSSHNKWGIFILLSPITETRRDIEKSAWKTSSFIVEPWGFIPGFKICYVAAPDGLSMELTPSNAIYYFIRRFRTDLSIQVI